jgi:YD repeat-containing protein
MSWIPGAPGRIVVARRVACLLALALVPGAAFAVDPAVTSDSSSVAGLSTAGVAGKVTTTYNSRHDPVTAVNAKGVTTAYAYDAAGNLTAMTRTTPGGEVLADKFTPNSRGLVTTWTDARLKVTTYGYNAGGDLISVTTPAGRSPAPMRTTMPRPIPMMLRGM